MEKNRLHFYGLSIICCTVKCPLCWLWLHVWQHLQHGCDFWNRCSILWCWLVLQCEHVWSPRGCRLYFGCSSVWATADHQLGTRLLPRRFDFKVWVWPWTPCFLEPAVSRLRSFLAINMRKQSLGKRFPDPNSLRRQSCKKTPYSVKNTIIPKTISGSVDPGSYIQKWLPEVLIRVTTSCSVRRHGSSERMAEYIVAATIASQVYPQSRNHFQESHSSSSL